MLIIVLLLLIVFVLLLVVAVVVVSLVGPGLVTTTVTNDHRVMVISNSDFHICQTYKTNKQDPETIGTIEIVVSFCKVTLTTTPNLPTNIIPTEIA